MNPQFISRIVSAIQLSILLLILCMGTIVYVYSNQNFGNNSSNPLGSDAVIISQPILALTDEQKHGQELFTNNCASCHAITDETVVGPGLKGVTNRRPVDWILTWVKNPQKVIVGGDKYAVDLYNKFNKAQMTAFPGFKDEDIKSILAYIDAK
jgi:mono/diheme cytochrome c family protein